MILPTRPSRTGRARHMLIGEWSGPLVVVVIVAPLGTEALDIVSIHPASAKERQAYASTDRKPEDARISQEDWDEVSDTQEATDAQLAGMRPLRDGAPEIDELPTKRERGRPRGDAPKVNLTLRVDPAVVEACKATGPGWQTRMHDALAKGGEDLDG